jgi:hypothetical protein
VAAVSAPTEAYRPVDGSVTMSGSVEDWKDEGMQEKLRTGLSKGVGVKAKHVNITSVVAASALINFAIFQDSSYTGSVSIRSKLNDPITAAKIAETVEEETGETVVVNPSASKESIVQTNKTGNVFASINVVWIELTPGQLAGIVTGCVSFMLCCCALAFRLRKWRKKANPTLNVLGTPAVVSI